MATGRQNLEILTKMYKNKEGTLQFLIFFQPAALVTLADIGNILIYGAPKNFQNTFDNYSLKLSLFEMKVGPTVESSVYFKANFL
jgi:hypothetical protein